MNNLVNKRTVKVQSKTVKSEKSCTGLRDVPALILSGNWFESAGFGIGCKVDVIIYDNELIIKTL